MIWNEDVTVHHPGRKWIRETGGFGVFDSGINGISILTRILPEPLVVGAATLRVPAGAQTPIAVEIDLAGVRDDDRLHAVFDWGTPTAERSIEIVTRSGRHLRMSNSGRRLEVGGTVLVDEENLEYRRIYDRFAELIASGESQLDEEPLMVVADACLIGRTLPDDTVFHAGAEGDGRMA
jgi:predicted dehydrogenase